MKKAEFKKVPEKTLKAITDNWIKCSKQLVYDQSLKLSGTEFRVLLFLVDTQKETISYQDIGTKLGITISQITKIFKILVQKNLISLNNGLITLIINNEFINKDSSNLTNVLDEKSHLINDGSDLTNLSSDVTNNKSNMTHNATDLTNVTVVKHDDVEHVTEVENIANITNKINKKDYINNNINKEEKNGNKDDFSDLYDEAFEVKEDKVIDTNDEIIENGKMISYAELMINPNWNPINKLTRGTGGHAG